MKYEYEFHLLPPDLLIKFWIDKSPQPYEEDYKCSVCRQKMEEEESPLLLWSDDGANMAMICNECTPRVLAKLRTKKEA